MNQPEEGLPHGGLSAGEDAAQTREAPGRSGLSLLLRRGPTDAVVQQGQEEVGSEAEENAMAVDEVEKAARLSAVQLRKTCCSARLYRPLRLALGNTHGFGEAGAARGEHQGPEIIGPSVAIHREWSWRGRNRRSMQIADP